MPDWISQHLPAWAQGPLAWLVQPAVLGTLVGGSVLLFVLSLIGIPFFLTRVPADFFSRSEREPAGIGRPARPGWLLLIRILKNILGVILVLAGLVMLLIPGQGLLTIVAGLVLLEFPGKRRLERWVITRPAVHRPINALRRRVGRPPLKLPGGDGEVEGEG